MISIVPTHAWNYDAKFGVESTQISAVEGGGEGTMVSMHHVNEIREEMAKALPLSSSQNTSPNQSVQLSEMREEVQQLRHLGLSTACGSMERL